MPEASSLLPASPALPGSPWTLRRRGGWAGDHQPPDTALLHSLGAPAEAMAYRPQVNELLAAVPRADCLVAVLDLAELRFPASLVRSLPLQDAATGCPPFPVRSVVLRALDDGQPERMPFLLLAEDPADWVAVAVLERSYIARTPPARDHYAAALSTLYVRPRYRHFRYASTLACCLAQMAAADAADLARVRAASAVEVHAAVGPPHLIGRSLARRFADVLSGTARRRAAGSAGPGLPGETGYTA